MLTLLAALPVLAAATLILALRQSAVRAGLVSLGIALAIALLTPAFALPIERCVGALEIAAGLTLNIALVLLGGLMLFRVLRVGGGLEALSSAVARALPEPGLRTLVLVFGVSVFFESAAGFGVSIVVCAPLFAALGLDARRGALAALMGQCAVPWGGLAVGTVLGEQLAGVPPERIAALGAGLSVPYVLICGAVALWLVGGRALLRTSLIDLVVGALVMLGVAAGASEAFGVELAGVLAGLAIIGLGLLRQRLARAAASPEAPVSRVGRTLLPLAVLIGALLITRLVPAVRAETTSHLILDWPAGALKLPLIHHPGFWLLLASATAIVSLRIPGAALGGAIRAGLRQWVTASLAVAGFIGMAQVMFQAGMTAAMAEQIAATTGGAYPVLLPFVGGFSGFLTASNSAANAMLAQLQQILADRLHLPTDWVAAAQNASASNATLASPGRVVLAAVISGDPKNEARLMRPALLVVLAGLATMSVLLWVGLRVWG